MRSRKGGSDFRFNKGKNRVVTKGSFFLFKAVKREKTNDSFGGKRRGVSGGFSFSKKNKAVVKQKGTSRGIWRDRSAGSFGGKVAKRESWYHFNKNTRRTVKSGGFLRRKHERETSSWGGTKKKAFVKMHVYKKKSRRVAKHDGFFYDFKNIFIKKKRHKKDMELELFDPKMRRKVDR